MVNKGRPNSMEVEMAAPQAQNRLKNPNSKRPKTTMSTGLFEEALGATHTEEDNVSLGQTQCIKQSLALQIRTWMLSGLFHFQAAQESSTDINMSSWDIQRAYDTPSKTDIKLAWMRLGIPPYIADYLIAIDSEG